MNRTHPDNPAQAHLGQAIEVCAVNAKLLAVDAAFEAARFGVSSTPARRIADMVRRLSRAADAACDGSAGPGGPPPPAQRAAALELAEWLHALVDELQQLGGETAPGNVAPRIEELRRYSEALRTTATPEDH